MRWSVSIAGETRIPSPASSCAVIHTASNDLTVSFFPVFLRDEVDLRGRRKMMRPGANMGMMSLVSERKKLKKGERRKGELFLSFSLGKKKSGLEEKQIGKKRKTHLSLTSSATRYRRTNSLDSSGRSS